jgi:FKBP-type peptidyl-prolyl cis-trans isomerase 2
VTIKPEEGYGYPDEKNLITVPIQELPPDLPKTVGTQVQMQTPDNRVYTGVIVAVDAETITVDFNHPLAGKTLNFWVKIVDVK